MNDLNSLIQGSFELFETMSPDVLPLDAIRMKLMEVGWNFVDVEFPPVESSLYPATEAKPIQ